MPRMLGLACALTLVCTAGIAAPRPHPQLRPNAASLLSAQPITPNGTLIRDGERLRTLELDELGPLRLRLSIPF